MDLTPASRAQLSQHHRHLSHLPARPSTAQACRTQRQNLDCIKLLIKPKETAQLGGESGRVTSGGRPVPLICSPTSRLAAGGTVLAYAPEDEFPVDTPRTSGRELGQPKAVQRPSSLPFSVCTGSVNDKGEDGAPQPMLQLVAAWDSLSARLPLGTGAGADAEVLLGALKLVLAGATRDGAARALTLASRLAEAAKAGVPLDAGAIAAGILRQAFPAGHPGGVEAVSQRLGSNVAALLMDLEKAARLPSRVDLYDDDAAAALRELCLAFYDVRATSIEIVSRLHALKAAAGGMHHHPEAGSSHVPADVQVAALEALQIFAPLGHALGLGAIATELEQLSLRLLFPSSYASTVAWLETHLEAAINKLDRCSATLQHAVSSHCPAFHELASGVNIVGRIKSPHSTLKKLLRLGDTAKGGRARADIHDVIALRAVVMPRTDVASREEAEAMASKACYLVQHAAHEMWTPLPGRSKDYIADPKANGYQSLHSTLSLTSSREWEGLVRGRETDASCVAPQANATTLEDEVATMELQVRTATMHERAERGDAAHAAYKGGLDASQARQLQQWTQELLRRGASGVLNTIGGGAMPNISSFPSGSAATASVAAADNNAVPSTSLWSSSSSFLDDVEIFSSNAAIDEHEGGMSVSATTSAKTAATTAASEALFRSLDLNGDGRVSLEELRAAVAELAGGDAEAEALLLAADSNADGTVSLQEFMEFQRRVGQAAAAAAMDKATANLLIAELSSKTQNQHTQKTAQSRGMASSLLQPSSTVVSSSRIYNNAPGSTSAFHVWDRQVGAFLCRAPQRDGAAVAAAFIDRDAYETAGNGGSSGSSLDEPLPRSASAAASNGGTTAVSSRLRGLDSEIRRDSTEGGNGSLTRIANRQTSTKSSTNGASGDRSAAGISSTNGRKPPSNGHVPSSQSRNVDGASNAETNNGFDVASSSASPRMTQSYEDTAEPLTLVPPPPSSTSHPQLQGKPDREQGWQVHRAVHSFMRVFTRAGVQALEARWELVPLPFASSAAPSTAVPTTTAAAAALATDTNTNKRGNAGVLDAAGRPFSSPIALPRHGPCVLGAVFDKDCDLVLDVPTVSGRHARFEVIRVRPAHRAPTSKLVLMDMGSTNGTWVNRAKIVPFKEVPLYPGDVVCFAEARLAFEVRVHAAATPSFANDDATIVSSSSAAAAVSASASMRRGDAASGPLNSESSPDNGNVDEQKEEESNQRVVEIDNSTATTTITGEDALWGPAVAAALRIAASLEAEAAARGVFAPAHAAGGVDVASRARQLSVAGEFQAAYMLLLGGAMARPEEAGLWAQLAAMERQRARRRVQSSSMATARAFLRAAVERFEAVTDDAAARRHGLARVFSSWGQLEYDIRNDGPARILFQKAVKAARNHPSGAQTAGAAKLLFTWASREWRLGDAPLAARLCRDALAVEPENPFALTLLGNISAAAGEASVAKELFQRAVESDPTYVTALQSWARLEAKEHGIKTARKLFRRALDLQSENCFVLQAWAVAEGRAGRFAEARRLLQRCTQVDPACRAAWHAWGKLEEAAGDASRAKELYRKVLVLKPDSVEALSALGRLEHQEGNLASAEAALQRALIVDPRHAPSLQELAAVRRSQGCAEAEAYRLEKRARKLNADKQSFLAQARRGGLHDVSRP